MRVPAAILVAVTGAGCGGNPAPPGPPTSPPAPLLAWVFEAPHPGTVLATPAVTPDAIYLAALHIDSTPEVVGDRAYVGSGTSRRYQNYQVVCLSAATGNPVWRTPVSLPAWGNPLVAGGRVYIGLGNGRLTESARPPETPAVAL